MTGVPSNTQADHGKLSDVESAVDVKHVETKKPFHPLVWNFMIIAGYTY
jgi:hypothetical protein